MEGGRRGILLTDCVHAVDEPAEHGFDAAGVVLAEADAAGLGLLEDVEQGLWRDITFVREGRRGGYSAGSGCVTAHEEFVEVRY
jgi:hypothetical protein